MLSSIDPAHPALTGAARVERCVDGRRIELGALRVDVLRPLVVDYARPGLGSNAASCVITVTLGPRRVLLTGDLPAREEEELVARFGGDLRVDWLWAPHHGSRSPSSEALLAATRPTWVSVQAGYRNRLGHPDPQLVARYVARGVHMVRSDESGLAQWRFRVDGRVDVHRWRASAHR